MNEVLPGEVVIRTQDLRLRVFVSSTLGELAEERRAVARAISALRLTSVLFEAGARRHPPRQVYRAYLARLDGAYRDRAPRVAVASSPERACTVKSCTCARPALQRIPSWRADARRRVRSFRRIPWPRYRWPQRLVRGEEHRGLGEVLGLAEPTERRLSDELAGEIAALDHAQVRSSFRHCGTGRERVDADAARPELPGQSKGERVDRPLVDECTADYSGGFAAPWEV